VFAAFTKWGGLSRYKWTLRRHYPHKELKLETESLIGYDCGVLF